MMIKRALGFSPAFNRTLADVLRGFVDEVES